MQSLYMQESLRNECVECPSQFILAVVNTVAANDVVKEEEVVATLMRRHLALRRKHRLPEPIFAPIEWKNTDCRILAG
jgi:hypothetical protein